MNSSLHDTESRHDHDSTAATATVDDPREVESQGPESQELGYQHLSDEERRAKEAEAAQIAARYDAESRVRQNQPKPLVLLISAVSVAFALYHMYVSFFGSPPVLVHRAWHVSGVLFLTFLIYPPVRGAQGNIWRAIDGVLALAALAPAVHLTLNYETILRQAGRSTAPDLIIAVILLALVAEAARRLAGWALPILAGLFFIYGIVGRELPGMLKHRGYDWDTMAYNFATSTEGVFGTPVGVAATYIFLFILFGAFLNKSGMSALFNDLALAIAGQSRGGPAKVATIASGLMGSINGSAIANVVSTGAFTIPLMKKIGYPRNFAGAVESTASVGGQLLPPIMGAAAFIMAETLGVPYAEVALAAIVPAVLYYVCLIVQIHLRATRLGLKGISKDSLPSVLQVLKERGHLLIPLVALIYMLFFSGRTIIFSALITIVLTVVVAQLRSVTRMGVMDILSALEEGTRSILAVSIACACVGIVIGVVGITGFGLTLAGGIVSLAGGHLFFTLVFTMLACLVLGMGLPSIPAYIVTATMAAPALTQLGVEPLAAHLFVFYFGLFANITPPVALAAFAAAGVSGGDPMKTGLSALRLAAAGFVIPYIFVFNSELITLDVGITRGIIMLITALVAILLLSVALEGHLMVHMPTYLRILLAAGAILILNPNITHDLIGLGIVVAVLIAQSVVAKKEDNLRFAAI